MNISQIQQQLAINAKNISHNEQSIVSIKHYMKGDYCNQLVKKLRKHICRMAKIQKQLRIDMQEEINYKYHIRVVKLEVS